MRKMKRGLSLVLASIMATALVGCSGGENTETTNTATTTENKETTGTTQAADENQEEITLRFVSWQTNHDEQNQKVAAAYKEMCIRDSTYTPSMRYPADKRRFA